jgi:DNA end-binding protein Ku
MSIVIESTSCSALQPSKTTEEAEEPGGQVVDLMAALQESVRKGRAARGEDAGDAEVREMPTAKRKTVGREDGGEGACQEDRGGEEAGPAAAGRLGVVFKCHAHINSDARVTAAW